MRVCVVGYGKMGHNHERVLLELGHEVVTVDTDPDAGADFSLDVREVLDRLRFDAVCIATPIENLFWQAKAKLDEGHQVLVEKPGASAAGYLGMLHTRPECCFVGYTERWNPAVQALKDNLHRVGVIQHINARRLGYAFDRAGDPALDLATHDLDVLDCLGFTFALEHLARSEHHVSALLSGQHVTAFDPNVFSVSLEASHLHPIKQRTLEVVGTDGILRLDYQDQSLFHIDAEGRLRNIEVDKAEPLKREWEAFFRGEGSDGIAALTIAEQMVEANAPAIAA